jgi:hypothetical protein
MVYNKINIVYNGDTIELTALGRKFGEANDLNMREERAADGTLRRDISSHKKRFTLSYDLIDGNRLDIFEDILLSDMELGLYIERRNGNFDNYNVLLQPYSYDRESARGDGLWSGFTAEFVEV